MNPADLRSATALAAVVLAAAALRLWGLANQPLTSDDLMVAFSAANYVETGHLGPTMWNHPGLRNLLVYGLLKLIGPNVWSLKLMSAGMGIVTVALLGLVTRRLLGPWTGVIAALLLAVDGLHIDFSRQAVHEVYRPCLALAGIACVLFYLEHRRWHWAAAAGLMFGFGLTAKWDAALVLIITVGWTLWLLRRSTASDSVSCQTSGLVLIITVGTMAVSVYLLSWLPVFSRGFSLDEWWWLQQAMLRETQHHAGYLAAQMEYDHWPALWFVKPVAYADFTRAGGAPVVLLGLSNPCSWLLVWPAIIILGIRAVKERSAPRFLLLALFLGTYLPFVLTTRPVWVHSAFMALPFAFAAVADMLARPPMPRKLLVIWLMATIAVAAPLYFLAIGKGLDHSWLRPLVESYRPNYER